MVFNVLFKLEFLEEIEGGCHKVGDIDFCSDLFSADNFLMAYDKALEYYADFFPFCDVTIISITRC